ncbi:retropepsin-like domain-containing protein [Sphingomonas daechungensis]|uniref:Retropepsin-like domain-containing protein n=1 Tax=Sphingomonas daechungensis TaxID=1176646 RepID=A0ABX6SZ98_9SPHN|nr:retropepsin-like domain-containing protein [Sphingomonas daechungensis]
MALHNGRLFIPAKIAGVSTEALLDSGAEGTIVDPTFAKQANLPKGEAIKIKGSGGEAPARVIPGIAVEALGISYEPEALVVTDLSEISSRLLEHPTHAIIGRELFDASRLRIDIRNGSIDPASPDQVPPGQRLDLAGHAGIEAIPVTVNGLAARAEFDLGNGSEVLISRAMAERLKLKVEGRKSGGGIGGEVQRDLVKLDSLQVAGVTFRDVTAAIDDQPSANDFNVGISILRNFLITTDFKGRAIWLEPVGAVPASQ